MLAFRMQSTRFCLCLTNQILGSATAVGNHVKTCYAPYAVYGDLTFKYKMQTDSSAWISQMQMQ